MTNKNLGRLERVELRDIWLSEASDFTPWLARKENLDILGATLGIDLELEAVRQIERCGDLRGAQTSVFVPQFDRLFVRHARDGSGGIPRFSSFVRPLNIYASPRP